MSPSGTGGHPVGNRFDRLVTCLLDYREVMKSARTVGDEGSPRSGAADDSVDRRSWILDAAVDEFGERGFAGARVDSIAERAGANKQLIYYYFKNKAGLYDAVLEYLMSQTRRQWMATGEVCASDFYHTLVDRGTNGSAWYRFLAWEALERGGHDILRAEQRSRELAALATNRVKKAQADGVISSDFDSEMLTLALVAMAIVPHMLPQLSKLISGKSPGDAKFIKRQHELTDQIFARLSSTGND